eukprot:gene15234-18030_t
MKFFSKSIFTSHHKSKETDPEDILKSTSTSSGKDILRRSNETSCSSPPSPNKSKLSSSCNNIPSGSSKKSKTLSRSQTDPGSYNFETVCRDYFPKATIPKSTGSKIKIIRQSGSNRHSATKDDDDEGPVNSYGMASVLVGCLDTYDQKKRDYMF